MTVVGVGTVDDAAGNRTVRCGVEVRQNQGAPYADHLDPESRAGIFGGQTPAIFFFAVDRPPRYALLVLRREVDDEFGVAAWEMA